MKLIIDRDTLEDLGDQIVWEPGRALGVLKTIMHDAERSICILIVSHRHGQDVHAATSEGRLMEFLAEFCRQYWDEERAKLDVDWLPREAPEDDTALIQQYFCMAREESWDLHPLIEIE